MTSQKKKYIYIFAVFAVKVPDVNEVRLDAGRGGAGRRPQSFALTLTDVYIGSSRLASLHTTSEQPINWHRGGTFPLRGRLFFQQLKVHRKTHVPVDKIETGCLSKSVAPPAPRSARWLLVR